MADVLTIIEKKGKIDGLKVVYIGDGNNMVHSWMRMATRFKWVVCGLLRGYGRTPGKAMAGACMLAMAALRADCIAGHARAAQHMPRLNTCAAPSHTLTSAAVMSQSVMCAP